MKRARDIRDQLEGLLERVEIEQVSNLDFEVIKKAITSGNLLLPVATLVYMLSILFLIFYLSIF